MTLPDLRHAFDHALRRRQRAGFAGTLFPFLFITIACGSVSGFHALVSSGTTPKMLQNESQARAIGYGAMLTESFVAIMALIAASVLQPGAYFAMNAPPAAVGSTVQAVAANVTSWGFSITPDDLTQLAHQVGESTILARAGAAPTLAVGMASIFSRALGGAGTMAFWYHFAILFEALFILTTLDAGTRVARFMIQDFGGTIFPAFGHPESLAANIAASAIAVFGWGFFLYQGRHGSARRRSTRCGRCSASPTRCWRRSRWRCAPSSLFKLKRGPRGVGGRRADGVARRLHADRRRGKSVFRCAVHRLSGPRREIRRGARETAGYWRRPGTSRKCTRLWSTITWTFR